MKVGLDISQTAFVGGVSEYTKRLASGLSKRLDLEMVYFYSSLRHPYGGNLKDVRRYPFPPSVLEPVFNKLRAPIELFIGKIDLFHSSDWTQPCTKAKKVTTCHDVIPLIHPEWSTSLVVDVHKRRFGLVEKEIDMVIAVSEATKHDLLSATRIPEEKITVIYEGVDESFKPSSVEKIAEFKNKMKLPKNFVLAIGGVGVRRNLERVKEATRGYNLVITGQTIPWVADSDRPLLYASADLLCYPSLYEGFGLPVLEAMACGTPVVTSKTSSLSEISGRAALLVNPLDVEEIAKAVKIVYGDKSLQKELKKRGLAQAAKFSWDTCVEKTVELYKKLHL